MSMPLIGCFACDGVTPPIAEREFGKVFPACHCGRDGELGPMTEFNCPNCGAGLPVALKSIRQMSCSSCGTSVFLSAGQALAAGDSGVMHDAPLLFHLDDQVVVEGVALHILGHARFSYGRGAWDEFWAVAPDEARYWLSVDEGDVILQSRIPGDLAPVIAGWPRLGAEFAHKGRNYTATETSEAECIAVRGSFDERIAVGDRQRYVNLQGPDGLLLSLEQDEDGETWFQGRWLDPFEIAGRQT